MRKEIKAKWLENLRSGKYPKGRKCLRSTIEESYCCLGVLCEQYTKGTWSKSSPFSARYNFTDKEGDVSGSYLTPGMRVWARINSDDVDKLAKLNDATTTFKEVIEYIEENL